MLDAAASIEVVLSDWTDMRRLRALISNGLGEPDFRTDFERIECHVRHTVTMEVNLAAIRRSNESVVVFRMQRRYASMRGHVVGFDLNDRTYEAAPTVRSQ